MIKFEYQMKIQKIILTFSAFFIFPNFANAADKLLQQSDFTYLGAFKVPTGDMGGPQYHGLAYGGSAIGYNPVNNSLFIVSHDQDQLVGEINIPQEVNSTNLADLNRATVVQNLVDITEGNRLNLKANGDPILVNGTKIGGLLKYGDKLIGSIYAYYDAGHEAFRSHFRSDLNLATTGDFEGVYEVGNKPSQVPQAGFVGGYMTTVPADWQVALGGPVLTGMSAISILGRTSSGPASFAFNPADMNASFPASATPLLYYNMTYNCVDLVDIPGQNICDNQTIGSYYTSQTLYNKGSAYRGVIFPRNSKSIIFTGQQGLGQACYGPGTNILAESGNRYNFPAPNNTCGGVVMTDVADPCCYDPENLNKGAHAYPYVNYAWAYDAEDLARIKTGGRIVDNPSPNLVTDISVSGVVKHAGVSPTSTETYKPWDIKPYAYWEISSPFTKNGPLPFGASAYDEVNRKMYIVQPEVEGMSPVVHVFSVNVDPIIPDVVAPSSPMGLSVQ